MHSRFAAGECGVFLIIALTLSPRLASATICGDGVISSGEGCDGNVLPPGTPPGACCDPSCRLIAPLCGDGIVAACGEQCEPPGQAFCNNQCQSVNNDACNLCSSAQCSDLDVEGCSPVGGASGSQACYDVLRCVYQTHCDDAPGIGVGKCFCGSLPSSACQVAPLTGPGSPDGACAALMAASLQAATSVDVLRRLSDLSFPGGWALRRFECEKALCKAACVPAAVVQPVPAPASSAWSAAVLALGLLAAGTMAARLSWRRRRA